MTTGYDVVVSGADAETVVIPPVNGQDGIPLGVAGNGANGVGKGSVCQQQAGPGLPGNTGGPAPGAKAGANGGDAHSVTITCDSYTGAALRIANFGGKGANGNSGGVGGKGGDGGNAGNQPKGCKLAVPGGVGGSSGAGGNAGPGGNGGNAGAIVATYGSGFQGVPVSATGTPGNGGGAGAAGGAGVGGQGGVNSDGTNAYAGGTAGGGSTAGGGAGGSGGSFTASTDPTRSASYLRVSVQTTPSV